jgi:hypothetical protein
MNEYTNHYTKSYGFFFQIDKFMTGQLAKTFLNRIDLLVGKSLAHDAGDPSHHILIQGII